MLREKNMNLNQFYTQKYLAVVNNKVDLTDLNMLMLKNRIDQWKKEVRLAGYTPIIYINYREK